MQEELDRQVMGRPPDGMLVDDNSIQKIPSKNTTPPITSNQTAVPIINTSQITSTKIRQFPENSTGPYVVYVRRLTKEIHIISMNTYLHASYKTITCIKPLNDYKVRIVFGDISEANKLPMDDNFKDYRVYIPAKDVECYGTINLSTDCDASEILTTAVGKFTDPRMPTVKLLDVHRNMIKDANNELIPRGTVRVTFEGSVTPNYISINHLIIRVEKYTPRVFFCTSCLRYGHSNKFCDRKPICAKCQKDHISTACSEDVTIYICKDCGINQETGHKDCIKRKEQQTKRRHYTNISQRFSYAQIVAGYDQLNVSESVDEEFYPDLSNPHKRKRVNSQPSKSSNKKEQNPSRSSNRPVNPESDRVTPPGFLKLEDDNIQDYIAEFLSELEIPPFVSKLIETFIVPIIIKIWRKFNSKLSSLLLSESNV